MNGERGPNLRLVGVDDDLPDSPDIKNHPILADSSHIRLVARQLARILVDELGKSLAINGGCEPPSAVHVPIGRIEREPSTIWGLLDEWTQHMRDRRMSKGSIDAYRSHVRAAVLINGWSDPSDLTYDAIVGHLSTAGATWQGTTYNRNLTIWRSLCKWLRARKLLDEDPLALASRRPDDSGPGSRAATTEEVRRMVAHAWAKAQTDKRASPFTARYYAVMALAGCRAEDPAPLLWRHFQLDEPVPFLHWEPDFNKNGKRQYNALAPELVDILKMHREHCRATERPTGPDDPVWPEAVSPVTFRTYRETLGIAPLDAFGMRFSAHSFRKWHSTVLTNAGVPAKMVDVLMRHTGSVEARYYKPTLEEQRRALELLPRIWPEIIGSEVSASSWTPTACDHASKNNVDSTPGCRHNESATRSPTTTIEPIAAAFGRESEPLTDRVATTKGVRTALKGGRVGDSDRRAKARAGGAVQSPVIVDLVMPIAGSKIEVDRIALAQMHELIARLLREGAGHGNGNERAG